MRVFVSKGFSIRWPVFILIFLGLVACEIEFGGPGNAFVNGVPYVAQEQWNYCVPASIQMCAMFYGRTPPSQSVLFSNMNGFGSGVEPQYIARELVRSANMYDAVLDHTYFDNIAYYRRQISATVQPSPVVAIINSGYHSGVLNGGQWHKSTDAAGDEVFVWDEVRFHDPNNFPNVRYTAAQWMSINCSESNPVCIQALSNAAASNTANVTVTTYGGGAVIPPDVQDGM